MNSIVRSGSERTRGGNTALGDFRNPENGQVTSTFAVGKCNNSSTIST
jgi:hypothetical protein